MRSKFKLYFLLLVFWPYGWERDVLLAEYRVIVYGRNWSRRSPK